VYLLITIPLNSFVPPLYDAPLPSLIASPSHEASILSIFIIPPMLLINSPKHASFDPPQLFI